MAGGLFVDQPFHPNPKCLLFSVLIMALYWFSPPNKNMFMLPVIFLVSYVAMAWYDYAYHCNTLMYSGKTSLGSAIFKPQRRQNQHTFVKNQEQAYLQRVYIFHLVAVVPLLIAVGYYGKHTPPNLFPILLTLGILALGYHSFRLLYPRDTTPTAEENTSTQ